MSFLSKRNKLINYKKKKRKKKKERTLKGFHEEYSPVCQQTKPLNLGKATQFSKALNPWTGRVNTDG